MLQIAKHAWIAALSLILGLGSAQAIPLTIAFDAADIVGYAALPGNTSNKRVIGDGQLIFSNKTEIDTFKTSKSAPNPQGFNAWIDSLDAQHGISNFMLWLQESGTSNAGLWGETLAFADPYSSDIVINAPEGWSASIYTMPADKWGTAWAGRKMITFHALGTENYLRAGSMSEFSFTADLIQKTSTVAPLYQLVILADASGLATTDGANTFKRAVEAHSVPDSTSLSSLLLALCGLLVFGRARAKKI